MQRRTATTAIKTPEQSSDLRVVDDFPNDAAITTAELDAIEAFLSAQLRAILGDVPDAEPPKCPASVRQSAKEPGERR